MTAGINLFSTNNPEMYHCSRKDHLWDNNDWKFIKIFSVRRLQIHDINWFMILDGLHKNGSLLLTKPQSVWPHDGTVVTMTTCILKVSHLMLGSTKLTLHEESEGWPEGK